MIAMPRIGLRETVFSANCFAAAMLALFVSFSLGLERPFWAMATVYITSQPLSGAVRSKAVFRLIGTMIGGLVTVLLVPALVNAPVLLSLALALWVAGCQFVSLLDRTPRSYVFMLAGYTAALIGFPSVLHPEAIFETAVLRVQEIGIGVSCAAIIHSVVWPRSVAGVYGARAKAVLANAESWIADILAVEETARTTPERRRLAADVTDLHVTATHIPFDTARIRPTRGLLTGLQDVLVQLIPLVSALEDRLRSLSAEGALPTDVSVPVAEVRAWVLDPTLDAPRIPTPPMAADWRGLLVFNLSIRLNELVGALGATRALVAAVADPEALRPVVAHVGGRPLHRDYGLGLLSAAATFLTILGCCWVWIATGWPEGAVAAMIAAVVCCFFATLDDPVPAQRGFLIWTVFSVPLAAVYLFAILPAINGFAMLCLALAPPLLLMGAMMAVPSWYGRMMPMQISFASGLALTNLYTVDAASFFNSNVAQLIGIVAAMTMTRLVRSMGAGTAIRRLRRAGWRDLAALVERPSQLPVWRSRMLDRVGLLAGRVGEAEDEDAATAALRELRIGLSLARIAQGEQQQALRASLAYWFRQLMDGRDPSPPADLLDAIDGAIEESRSEGGDPERLAALVGLRRNVFPAAPGWSNMRLAA
ncbi:FUSC family protein [Sphingomonas sanguinis]|uniref:FUSC family protein n=1 Tax=Sphingomonas sp. LC-1 TaxID=3110957 RepID=UPI0021BB4068|nr:FUSC family protein [Sphingomonas sp. LC-1]MCT8003397.1 FUSC family protein [Sphingomonas sp. LC-1]